MVSITLDALKFFHSFLGSLIDIGGSNLPATVASHLGSKLGKLYKERGISGIEEGLRHSYEVLNAKTQINRIDTLTYEFIMDYPDNFCPIGGDCDPKRAEVVQKSICYPYTIGFLNEIDPNAKYTGEIKECILQTNENRCRYLLRLEEQSNIEKVRNIPIKQPL